MGGTMGGAPKHAKPGSSRWQPNKPNQPGQPSQPHYGGPTPPPGWTYPGQQQGQQGPNPQQQGPGERLGGGRGGVDKQEARGYQLATQAGKLGVPHIERGKCRSTRFILVAAAQHHV